MSFIGVSLASHVPRLRREVRRALYFKTVRLNSSISGLFLFVVPLGLAPTTNGGCLLFTSWYFRTIFAKAAQSFLEGPRIALVSSQDYHNGHYTTPPQHGIRAFARVYSAWAYGQTVSTSLILRVRSYPRHLNTAVVPQLRSPVQWQVYGLE